jgi:hypothetical protein
VLLGNHDRRAAFRAVFPDMPVDFTDPGARWIAGTPADNVVLLERDTVLVHRIDRIGDAQIGYGQPCAGL